MADGRGDLIDLYQELFRHTEALHRAVESLEIRRGPVAELGIGTDIRRLRILEILIDAEGHQPFQSVKLIVGHVLNFRLVDQVFHVRLAQEDVARDHRRASISSSLRALRLAMMFWPAFMSSFLLIQA